MPPASPPPVGPMIQLVDDDDAVRASLGLLLASVGLGSTGWRDPVAFLAGFDRSSTGAILLDVRMPGLGGLAVLERLVEIGVDQPVIMLTGHGTVDLCRRAFRGGAVDFLEKPVDDDRLLEAVLDAVRWHVGTRERLAADREARERHGLLSPREHDVLAGVVLGQTNKEIARELGLSPRTVETHRTHLSQKLGVGSLAELIRRYAALVDERAAGPPP